MRQLSIEWINKERHFLNDLKKVFQNRWIDINDNNLKYLAKKYNFVKYEELIKIWGEEKICVISYNADRTIKYFMFYE